MRLLKIETYLFLRAVKLPALDKIDAPESGSKRRDKNPCARVAMKEDPNDLMVLYLEQAGQKTIKRCHPQEFCMRRQWSSTAAGIKIE